MRVLHVIPSLSPQDGGPSAALPLMARALRSAGCEVTVATTAQAGAGEAPRNLPAGEPVAGAGGTYHYFARQSRFYKFSLPLARWLASHMRDYDLVHIHALFSYSSVVAARTASRQNVPYVVRPLGVLNRWGLENRRRIVKKLSLRWVELPILRRASAIHYTSEQERREAAGAAAGIGALPSVVIPLGIDTSAYAEPADPAPFFLRYPRVANRDLILFLSRVDAKKGLDLLLPAFAQIHARKPRAVLVVAGDGEAAYLASLRAKAESLGIAEHVLWTGFLAGADKRAALAAATAFVLPSYSENFGIAAAEALAAGVPSVLSNGVAIAEDAAAGDAAMVVPCEVPALADALTQLLASPERRATLRVNARELAQQRFSLRASGQSLVELYRSILQPTARGVPAVSV